jgi:hypothetical protein
MPRPALFFPLAALWAGCAYLPGGASAKISVQPADRLYLQVAPFDSAVRAELTRLELDPDEVHQGLASELRYQLFLRKLEESPDSAGATLRVTVAFRHLQPGTGNSGSFVSASLLADRDKAAPERAEWELRRPAQENVPGEFLSLHLPRSLAAEILGRLQKQRKRSDGNREFTPQVMMLF